MEYAKSALVVISGTSLKSRVIAWEHRPSIVDRGPELHPVNGFGLFKLPQANLAIHPSYRRPGNRKYSRALFVRQLQLRD
jgi:hypothetical protein